MYHRDTLVVVHPEEGSGLYTYNAQKMKAMNRTVYSVTVKKRNCICTNTSLSLLSLEENKKLIYKPS